MSKHFEREIENLKRRTVALGDAVERQVESAILAVAEVDAERAERVVQQELEIDRIEIELEEECLKLLALYQPVAEDLRLIVAVLKINNDLERIGDHAASIAKRARELAERPRVEIPPALLDLAKQAKLMLRKSLLSLVEMNVEIAEVALRFDHKVNELNRELYRVLYAQIEKDPKRVEEHILVNSVGRRLERIGDHACNIAEDVIYLLSGEIVRHEHLRRDSTRDNTVSITTGVSNARDDRRQNV